MIAPGALGLEDLAARAGWRLSHTFARGSCPVCGSRTAAWGSITQHGKARVGCFRCDDWRGVRAALGLDPTDRPVPTWSPPPKRCGKTKAPDLIAHADGLSAVYRVIGEHLRMPPSQRRSILEGQRGIAPSIHEQMPELLNRLPRSPAGRTALNQRLSTALAAVAPAEFLRTVPELSARRGGSYVLLGSRTEARYFEPWMDEHGRTTALRAYMGPDAESKYMASPGRWGPVVHVTYGCGAVHSRTAPWLLCEGWMCAEVAARALDCVAIAIPGVSMHCSIDRAIDLVERAAPDAPVYIAFDAECFTTRPDIADRALAAALRFKHRAGRRVGFATWDVGIQDDGTLDAKGIDDAIVAGRDIRLLSRHQFGGILGPAVNRWSRREAA